jgi:hypothetical protein
VENSGRGFHQNAGHGLRREWRWWNGKIGTEDNRYKADPSLKSFLFTLKNPHNSPARKFALKAEAQDKAIQCISKWGPRFRDIAVSDNCNANPHSWSFVGNSYVNDTCVDGTTVSTGSHTFTMKQIEVFEITD